jgi:hypothetical protein
LAEPTRIRAMGIRDRQVSARWPWQNGYAERLIGSIRRECLDHVVVVGKRHLRHVLASYQTYYNEVRTHLSLHRRTRRLGVMCAERGACVSRRSWAGYTINMFEFEFPTGTTPPAVEQVRIEPILPLALPSEAEDPELAVALIKKKEPREEQSPLAPLLLSPAVPTEAAKAMARPISEIAQESARSDTPAQGTGESAQRVRAAWQKQLIAHFNQHKRYPANGSLDSAEILVNFVLD